MCKKSQKIQSLASCDAPKQKESGDPVFGEKPSAGKERIHTPKKENLPPLTFGRFGRR
jgi:hypothetical protein